MSRRLFTKGPQDAKAMSDLHRHVQGKDNRSIELLNEAPVSSPEGTVDHLMEVQFQGPHMRDKVKRTTRLLYGFKTLVGQLWGPNPFLKRWIYTGIIWLKVTYRAIIWPNRANKYKKH